MLTLRAVVSSSISVKKGLFVPPGFLPTCISTFKTSDCEESAMEYYALIAGLFTVSLLIAGMFLWRRRSTDKRRSRQAHEAAQQRVPPVEIGGTYEFGVIEFTDHHSGNQVAVGKVEGFVLFTEAIPNAVTEGDIIRAKVLSFNTGKTSATAKFVEKV